MLLFSNKIAKWSFVKFQYELPAATLTGSIAKKVRLVAWSVAMPCTAAFRLVTTRNVRPDRFKFYDVKRYVFHSCYGTLRKVYVADTKTSVHKR